jgi:hypothetical protein
LFLVSNTCTDKLAWQCFWLSTTKNINNNIYWQDTGKMSSFLNRFIHELSAPTPDIILTILICNVNTWHKLVEFPQIIPHLITECKYANYTNLSTSLFSMWTSSKHTVLTLGTIWSICVFQFSWLLICIFHSQCSIWI